MTDYQVLMTDEMTDEEMRGKRGEAMRAFLLKNEFEYNHHCTVLEYICTRGTGTPYSRYKYQGTGLCSYGTLHVQQFMKKASLFGIKLIPCRCLECSSCIIRLGLKSFGRGAGRRALVHLTSHQ